MNGLGLETDYNEQNEFLQEYQIEFCVGNF